MILNVSGRTDIVAFYSKWFINRYKEGFVDTRNPFYPKKVSRIYFKDVDAILFCTKNPLPIINYLQKIKKPIIFQVTLTPYKKNIEPNVPNKKQIIEAIKKISGIVGIDNLSVRYDPIFLNKEYTLEYHLKAFAKLCKLLNGYVNRIIISFLDNYKNVQKNLSYIKCLPFTTNDYKKLGEGFSKIAKENKMMIHTCFEKVDLVEYGFVKSCCVSHEYAYNLTGKTFKSWSARKCNCVEMVDIGVYNSCKHFCKYCYANYDENMVKNNFSNHDPNSTMLVGHLMDDDLISIRRN